MMRYVIAACLCGLMLVAGCGGGGGGASSISASGISLVTTSNSSPYLSLYGPLAVNYQPLSSGIPCYGLPSFSPDGTLVVFASTYGLEAPNGDELPCPPPYDGGYYSVATRIFLASTRYGGSSRLQHSGYGHSPAFSWDSRKVVFCHYGEGEEGIYIIDIDGTDEHKVPGISGGSPAFSPDGRRIAYVSSQNASQADIYVANIDGTGVRRLTNSAVAESGVVFSPDGSKIAYLTYPDNQICVMNADGGGNRVLGTCRSGHIKFSPDSRQVLYAAPAGTAAGLYSKPVDGGAAALLLPLSNAGCDFICQ